MVDASESKVFMSNKNTLIRSFMAGAVLGLAAMFAIAVTIKTDSLPMGSILFPIGFIMLYLMKFDLLTGVFTLVPLALLDLRNRVLRRFFPKGMAIKSLPKKETEEAHFLINTKPRKTLNYLSPIEFLTGKCVSLIAAI